MHTYIYIQIFVYMYICTNDTRILITGRAHRPIRSVSRRIYICIYTYIHTYICTQIYVYMYICTKDTRILTTGRAHRSIRSVSRRTLVSAA